MHCCIHKGNRNLGVLGRVALLHRKGVGTSRIGIHETATDPVGSVPISIGTSAPSLLKHTPTFAQSRRVVTRIVAESGYWRMRHRKWHPRGMPPMAVTMVDDALPAWTQLRNVGRDAHATGRLFQLVQKHQILAEHLGLTAYQV